MGIKWGPLFIAALFATAGGASAQYTDSASSHVKGFDLQHSDTGGHVRIWFKESLYSSLECDALYHAYLLPTHQRFEDIYAMLMTAKAAGWPVMVRTNTCYVQPWNGKTALEVKELRVDVD